LAGKEPIKRDPYAVHVRLVGRKEKPMKFRKYVSFWDNPTLTRNTIFRKGGDRRSFMDRTEFYDYLTKNPGFTDFADRASLEYGWLMNDQPYYQVYPCIVEMCEKLPLDTPVKPFVLPGVGHPFGIQSLAIHFPDTFGFRCMLFGLYKHNAEDGVQAALFAADTDPVEPRDPIAEGREPYDCNDGVFHIKEGRTIGDIIESTGDSVPMRVIICLSLLLDPELNLLERDICKRDLGKPTTDEVLARALKRKGLGWTLGREMDQTPHFRRPHWGIRWCGPGGKEPKLRPIKGAVVQRDKIESVPTGFADKA